MTRALVFSLACALAGFFCSSSAHAFEREWHLGGGLGVTAYPRDYSLGPALGVNGAYGISDVFDLKLELLGSAQGYQPDARFSVAHAEPLSLAAGLSYKLDVLQWIPYAALLVGYSHIGGTLPIGEPFHRDDAIAALVLGLDYAVSREFGLGLSLRSDLRLSTPNEGETFTPMLRAEYHWGF
ncbi:MAG TPA: outer membrane beta-barrel protein [Polyangiaceae bacterium]|jgi:hypothetical protein|nr:outer membrane beta-barrel protein [Polyangiaceae bacterium]